LELDDNDLESVPEINRLKQTRRGTLVVWQKLDRIFAGEPSRDRALQNKIDDARSHLGLVYHRFLESSIIRRPLSLRINNVPIVPSDPYLRGCNGSQLLPPESLNVDGHSV